MRKSEKKLLSAERQGKGAISKNSLQISCRAPNNLSLTPYTLNPLI